MYGRGSKSRGCPRKDMPGVTFWGMSSYWSDEGGGEEWPGEIENLRNLSMRNSDA